MVAQHIQAIANEMEENLLVHKLIPKQLNKENKANLILELEKIEEKQLSLSDVDWLYDQVNIQWV